MVYDFDYYPSYYYSRPQYYTSYAPSYFVGDKYYNAYRYYKPMFTLPSTYARARAHFPYRSSYDYRYNIPNDTTSRIYPSSAISRLMSPVYPEAVKYDYTYGMDFNSATQDIRNKASKLLMDVQAPSTRFTRASSLEPVYNSDYYVVKRASNRTRLMSEEPRGTSYRTIRYYYC